MSNSTALTKGTVVINITDDKIKSGAVEALQNEIMSIARDGNVVGITLDLSRITGLDSIGMSFLVKMHLMLRKLNKELLLSNVPDSVMDVFSTTNLDKNFSFDPPRY